MSVSHSALARKFLSGQARPVAAIVSANEAYPDAVFRTLVEQCRALRLPVAGVVQH